MVSYVIQVAINTFYAALAVAGVYKYAGRTCSRKWPGSAVTPDRMNLHINGF
jgi:hypothetical protein